jgi:hypothetical protein
MGRAGGGRDEKRYKEYEEGYASQTTFHTRF